jgi:TRAP-type C4-dicarboxylate transport system permease small subunit
MHNSEGKKEKKKGIAVFVKLVADAGLMGSNFFMAAMILIIMFNTAIRYVWGAPVFWGDTMMTWLMIVMVYMGLGSVIAAGSNLRMTALIDRLTPRTQAILETICSVLNVFYFCILVWAGFNKVENSYMTRVYDTGTDWMYWWPQAIIVVGCVIGLAACIVAARKKFNILQGKEVDKDEEGKVDFDSSMVNE